MNHELNGKVAEQVMRWKRHDWREHDAMPKTVYCCICGDTRAKTATNPASLSPTLVRDYCLPPARAMPNYSGSPAAAWHMEEEIEQQGLIDQYVVALKSLLWASGRHIISTMETWEFIHATPEQRCRAALEAAREK